MDAFNIRPNPRGLEKVCSRVMHERIVIGTDHALAWKGGCAHRARKVWRVVGGGARTLPRTLRVSACQRRSLAHVTRLAHNVNVVGVDHPQTIESIIDILGQSASQDAVSHCLSASQSGSQKGGAHTYA
jgi:hypothetical protein